MRLRFLAPALTLATIGAPAYAQDAFDPATAVEDFLTDATTLGATEATVGDVSETDGTVTASDVAMRWTGSIESGDETATYTVEITMPTLEVSGLEETGEGYSAASITIPTLDFTFDATNDDEPVKYELTVTDYAIEDASWGRFPVIEPNPAAPVSRFAPLVDWAVRTSYQSNSIGTITGTNTIDDLRQEFRYGPFTIGPVENGTLAELNYGEITLTQTFDMPNEDGTTTPGEMTMTYGPITGRNIDIKPMAALLTGIDAGDGPEQMAERISTGKIVVDAGEAFKLTMGDAVVENFTLDPSRGPLMTKLDDLVVAAMNDEEPNPANLIELMLDIYGAYGFDLYSLQGIEMSGPDFAAKLGDMRIEGLSSAGLERVAILDGQMNGPNGSGRLGAFEMGGFVFPAKEAVMDAIMQGMAGAEPTPQAIMAAAPTLGNISVSGLNVDAANVGTFDLGNFTLTLSDYLNAIPTSISIALEGLVMPASMLPDPSAVMMAQMIGADPVTADGTIALRWDEDTMRVELDEDLTIGNIGRLETEATLSGIPKVVFEDPQRVQEALATAAVNGLTMRFEDQGITEFLLGMVSQQSGVPADQFVEGIAGQVEGQLGAITGDAEFASEVAAAVRTYLADPQTLTVSASPANPVAVAQIMGAAMTAPAALPGLLNFSISANGQ